MVIKVSKICANCGENFFKNKNRKFRYCDPCRKIKTENRVERKRKYYKIRAINLKQERLEKRLKFRPWLDPSLTSHERQKLRRKIDPRLRLSRQLQKKKRLCGLENKLREGLKKCTSKGFLKRLGYTHHQLREHLENLFTEDMTWDIFYTGAIHIDHIKPLSLFDLTKEEEVLKAFALSNLQPLWAMDNYLKSNKYDIAA